MGGKGRGPTSKEGTGSVGEGREREGRRKRGREGPPQELVDTPHVPNPEKYPAANSIGTFRSRLKTDLFAKAYAA